MNGPAQGVYRKTQLKCQPGEDFRMTLTSQENQGIFLFSPLQNIEKGQAHNAFVHA